MTYPLNVAADGPDARRQAIAVLRGGGLVIYPTETFYALGADPQNAQALQRLLASKGRQASKGLPLIASARAAVAAAAQLPASMQALGDACWPGPLSLILRPGGVSLSPCVHAQDGTLAVRVSAHAGARALAAGMPCGLLVSTSANCAGKLPAAHLAALDPALLAQVSWIIDGGHLPGGAPSTLVALLPSGGCQIVRQGAVPADRVHAVLAGQG